MNDMGDMPAFRQSPAGISTNVVDGMIEINVELKYLSEDERELLGQLRQLN